MRVAILGAGAMGSWFGGRLAEAGADVQLLTTNSAHRDAINSSGLMLESAATRSTVTVSACAPEEVAGSIDLFILLTKSFQSQKALASVEHVIGDSTYVLSLQNGLGNSELIAEFVPQDHILVGMTMMPVDKVAPGVVKKTGDGLTRFGAGFSTDCKTHSAVVEKILALFSETDINIKHDDNIQKAIWEKVAFNAGINAVCALARGTPGNIDAVAGATELVKQVAGEVANVGAALGVVVDLDSVCSTIEYACANHKTHMPSMAQDLQAAKPTEVDALNGAVVVMAERCGVDVPLNKMLLMLVKVAENSVLQTDAK